MKKNIFIASLLVAFCFSACQVFSLYPLFTEEDIVFDEKLLGDWKKEGILHYTFERSQDSSRYNLTLYEHENNEAKAFFMMEATLFTLGGVRYLNLYPGEPLPEECYKDFAPFNMIAVFSIIKVDYLPDGKITFSQPDGERLKKLFEQKRIRLEHKIVEDQVLITANTKDFQKFWIKYAAAPEAFEKPSVLGR